jgi:uncharacterized protein YutE (UPF0331/DUF86 family)
MFDLEEYIADLEEARQGKSWEEFTEDKIFQRHVVQKLLLAIGVCLDIAYNIISFERYREPQNNTDTFEILKEQGIIGEELNVRLKEMIQFRDILVHDYNYAEPEEVYAVLQKNVSDIIGFAEYVKDYILD